MNVEYVFIELGMMCSYTQLHNSPFLPIGTACSPVLRGDENLHVPQCLSVSTASELFISRFPLQSFGIGADG